jgi:serine protease Do
MRLLIAILIAGLLGVGIGLLIYLPGEPPIPDGAGTAVATPGAQQSPAAGRWPDDIEASRRTAIVRAAETVGPAVVSISVIQTRVISASPVPRFRNRFFEDFFRNFYGERRYIERIPGMGSGVLVGPDGLVVTNEHGVRDAAEIKVTLTDGRQFDAEVVETVQDHDLAVLKIEGDDLPHVDLGDSDSLIIGEWAIAIGNPFGYLLEDPHPSVTVGVVSALHRDVKTGEGVLGVYKDMIQTDAAINPGNSGGALVNSMGQVIGINTFIITKSGGSMGIGFAIPASRVGFVLNEIRQYGRVRQIWIGLAVQEVTPMIAHSLGMQRATGVIIAEVGDGSPAAKAGLERGDVITEVNGRRVLNYESARRAIFGSRVGDSLSFTVLRRGDTHIFTLDVEEAPER